MLPEVVSNNNVNWVSIEEGVEFALRGRPSRKVLRNLVLNEHCTHVITIQGEREHSSQIQHWMEDLEDVMWVNIPLDNAKPIGRRCVNSLTHRASFAAMDPEVFHRIDWPNAEPRRAPSALLVSLRRWIPSNRWVDWVGPC